MSEASAVAAAVPAVSLDLSLHPDDAAAFWRAAPVRALRQGAPVRATQLSVTWHDSDARALGAAGLSLAEIRRGRLHAWRLEGILRNGDRRPGVTAPVLAEAPSRDTLGTTLPEAVDALATFRGECRAARLPPGAAVASLQVRTGTLHAVGGDLRPACRVALDGPAPEAFALARAVAGCVRLQVPLRGLAEEASGEGRPHLGPALLGGAATVADARAMAVGQLAETLLFWAPQVDARRPEPVHQMRVTLRRLRAALKVLDAASGAEVEAAAMALRDLARCLGEARDWDVFLRGVARQVMTAFPAERAIVRLVTAAERQRLAAYARLDTALGAADFRVLGLRLAELSAARGYPEGAPVAEAGAGEALLPFARAALSRRLRKALRAGSRFADRTPAERHALRLHCKRLRYAAEMFAPLFGGGAGRFVHRLSVVQDRLGALNDAAVAETLMQQLETFRGRPLAIGLVRGYLTAGGARQADKAARSWRRFRHCEPFWI